MPRPTEEWEALRDCLFPWQQHQCEKGVTRSLSVSIKSKLNQLGELVSRWGNKPDIRSEGSENILAWKMNGAVRRLQSETMWYEEESVHLNPIISCAVDNLVCQRRSFSEIHLLL